MPRPHCTARTMVAKESSSSTMSLASFETSVPEIPIAMPTSAFFIAGASLMPSPVTATTLPSVFSILTTLVLMEGVLRAITRIAGIRSANSASESFSSSLVSAAQCPSSRSPSSPAMAAAVVRLSPVRILTSMPAPRQRSTASNTSARRGSAMAANPSNAMSLSIASLLLP